MTALSQTGTFCKFWDPRMDPFRFWLENSNLAGLIPKVAIAKNQENQRIEEERVRVCEGSRSNRARRPRSCIGTQLAPSFHGGALLIRDPGQDDS